MSFCGGKRIQLRLMAFLIFLSSPVVALAAKIDVISLGPNKPSLVTIEGEIELGDKDQFLRKIGPVTNAIVAFNSDGGNLVAGIQIGELIRLRNFASLVPDGMRCASSCALAWLGGTRRLMASKAQIGFHAASDRETGKVTSVGNALVGAYLNKIGLPYSAVVYITSAAPEEISWLSKSDAEKLGIEVSLYKAPDDPKVSTKPEPPRALSIISQYVVQVSSQRSSNNASAAYEVLQEKFAILRKHSPIILRADVGANGVFYRAAVGPFATADAASEFCDSLRAEGGICVVQKLTQDAVTPAQQLNNPPSQSSARTAPKTPEPTGAKRDTNLRVDSTEKETRNFIAASNRPNAETLAFLQNKYTEQVSYFGKMQSRSEVLNDKKAFFNKWPRRTYVVKPDTLRIDCSAETVCKSEGVVNWMVSGTKSESLGSATFALAWTIDQGNWKLSAEAGQVISRKVSRIAPDAPPSELPKP